MAPAKHGHQHKARLGTQRALRGGILFAPDIQFDLHEWSELIGVRNM